MTTNQLGSPSQTDVAVQPKGSWRPPSVPPRLFPVMATFVLFVAMFGAGSARYEGFGSAQVVGNLLIDNSYLIVLAVGMTFVILTGGIDLSVGSVLALSTMVAADRLQAGWSAPAVMVTVLVMGTTLGWVMGLLIHHLGIQPFIVTLAGMFLARGLCFLISTSSIPIRNDTWDSIAYSIVELPGGTTITYSVVIAFAVVSVAAYVLHLTRFGRTVYAVGGSESSAQLMGLNTGRVKVGVYAISGLCASLSGLLFTFYLPSGNPLHGVTLELDAIAAVVIGGTLLLGGVGYVAGTVIGVLVLGIIQTFLVYEGTLSSWWTKIVIGALLLVFIMLQRFMLRRQP